MPAVRSSPEKPQNSLEENGGQPSRELPGLSTLTRGQFAPTIGRGEAAPRSLPAPCRGPGNHGTGAMRILFLHNNYPAQFGGLARYLSEQGHEVRFGTRWEGTPPGWLRMVRFRPHREVGEQQHPYLRFLENAVLNGQALARVGWQMKEKGYSPDLVVAHSGWGPGLYVRDVWPDAKYLGYFEWYYRPDGADIGFLHPVTRDDGPRIRTRNTAILLDLAECHWGLVPTEYQASQFPALLRRKLTVQHDGVDTERFAPQPGRRLKLPGLDLSHVGELVTYVARGMEPYRGFPQAMSAFAEVQKRRPRAHIVVVGRDRVAYGRALPDGDTWRKKMLRELDLDLDRLHFTGLLPRNQYREVLLASSVHVYLTVPFVLSWSMIEAMSAGCVVVASDTAPVREVIRDGENGQLVDFFDTEGLAERICDALARPEEAAAGLREGARRTAVERYAASRLIPLRAQLLEAVASGLMDG